MSDDLEAKTAEYREQARQAIRGFAAALGQEHPEYERYLRQADAVGQGLVVSDIANGFPESVEFPQSGSFPLVRIIAFNEPTSAEKLFSALYSTVSSGRSYFDDVNVRVFVRYAQPEGFMQVSPFYQDALLVLHTRTDDQTEPLVAAIVKYRRIMWPQDTAHEVLTELLTEAAVYAPVVLHESIEERLATFS